MRRPVLLCTSAVALFLLLGWSRGQTIGMIEHGEITYWLGALEAFKDGPEGCPEEIAAVQAVLQQAIDRGEAGQDTGWEWVRALPDRSGQTDVSWNTTTGEITGVRGTQLSRAAVGGWHWENMSNDFLRRMFCWRG